MKGRFEECNEGRSIMINALLLVIGRYLLAYAFDDIKLKIW
jgi:hypothetical protein